VSARTTARATRSPRPRCTSCPSSSGRTTAGSGLNVLSKLAASLFAAGSVAFVYLAARELARRLAISEASALVTAGVYAAATPTWAVSSQGLWGHGPAQLALAVALWALIRAETERWGPTVGGSRLGSWW
jgi:hypothetical protein